MAARLLLTPCADATLTRPEIDAVAVCGIGVRARDDAGSAQTIERSHAPPRTTL